MKNDYSFKLVAAIIFLGVIVALSGPFHSAVGATAQTAADPVTTSNHAE